MYQPVFPLKMSERDGAYKSIDELTSTIKQNVLFLLNTSPGEWPSRPDMGVGIRRYLFENGSGQEWMELKARVTQQFKKYMPFLKIKSEVIEYPGENAAKLRVRYDVKSLNIQESLILSITQETSE